MVIIYGAPWCGWCQKAKALAEQYQLDFEYRDVDNDQHDYKAQLKHMLPNVKTIPQIWWHGRHIGGYEDFAKEIENTLNNYGQEAC
jgi:glutaredoxin